MNNTFYIALNTVREIQRHSMFYTLALILVFMTGGGFLVGFLSVTEQERLSINFSLAVCHIALVLFAIYFSTQVVAGEREKQTLLTLFARPVGKWEFLMGKFAGLSGWVLAGLVFLSLAVVFVYWFYERPLTMVVALALWGMFLEALILIALCFVFSTFASSFFVFICSTLLFVTGHSLHSALSLWDNLSSPAGLYILLYFVSYMVPDLERLNFKNFVVYQEPVTFQQWGSSSVYALLWVVLFLALSYILFKRHKLNE